LCKSFGFGRRSSAVIRVMRKHSMELVYVRTRQYPWNQEVMEKNKAHRPAVVVVVGVEQDKDEAKRATVQSVGPAKHRAYRSEGPFATNTDVSWPVSCMTLYKSQKGRIDT
jgi:hypothetical protein